MTVEEWNESIKFLIERINFLFKEIDDRSFLRKRLNLLLKNEIVINYNKMSRANYDYLYDLLNQIKHLIFNSLPQNEITISLTYEVFIAMEFLQEVIKQITYNC